MQQAKNTFTRKSLKSQLLLWGQTDYAIRSAIYELSEFLLVFYSYNSAITHRNFVFQQMTLIWPFKVTKGQTDHAIRSATYEFL